MISIPSSPKLIYMRTLRHFVFATIFCAVAVTNSFSQNNSGTRSSKTEGLRKISGPTHHIDVDIDEAAIAADVERSVAQAMKSVEATLRNLDIHIPEINLNMSHIDPHPVIVRVPHVNVHIPPIPPIPFINMDVQPFHNFNWNENEHRHDHHDSDDETQKAKREGLKKLN